MNKLALLVGSVACLVCGAEAALGAATCELGTRCLTVDSSGKPSTKPTDYVAQCSGNFPDFIVAEPMVDTSGPRFILSQNYPKTIPTPDGKWLALGFTKDKTSADEFLVALRDYAFDGMIDADFKPEKNKVRQWYHMPLMNFGFHPREPWRGLTSERSVTGPELGLKPGTTIHNFAIGFYNAVGAYTIGQVWSGGSIDLDKARFSEGSMTFKILFTDAQATDFVGSDILAGAPEWEIMTQNGKTKVRLLQMDVAAFAKDSPTGWVFGTLAYDASDPSSNQWLRMKPVGLSWGNDEGVTPTKIANGAKLKETLISDNAPAYAKAHLGWGGRTNGPVDNPVSGCISCHGTSQFPVAASLFPDQSCGSEDQKLQWFRNFRGTQAFGRMDKLNCAPATGTEPVALDFSLQMEVAVQSILQFNDTNPCATSEMHIDAKLPMNIDQAPRVER